VSDKKPVYLLAGGRPRGSQTSDPLTQAIFKESGKKSPSIAYIGTANGDSKDFLNRMAGVFIETGASRITHAIISPEGADLKKARNILESEDIVFVGGGDVDMGMRVLQEKGMVEFLSNLYKEGKLFFGTSAGAIMLAKEWVRWRNPDDSSSAELFPCLDIAHVICDCHDEMGGWEELKAALLLKEVNTKGYGLVSGTALKVFPNGNLEALGGTVHQYIRHNGGTDRIEDILPERAQKS
jgi:peptidase E